MHFISNKISLAPARSLSEIVKAAQVKAATVKTASVKEEPKVETEVKVACEGESSGQPEAEAKLVNHPKVEEGEKKTTSTPKKGKEETEAPSSGQPEAEAKLVNQPKVEGEKKATVTHKYVKIANLSPKQKEWLREYWSAIYPKAFVEAMIADK